MTFISVDSRKQHTATVEGDRSTVDSQQTRKRKRRKRSSSRNIDSKTSVKRPNPDDRKQCSKMGKRQRKNLNTNSEQSVKDLKHSVTMTASLSKKKVGAKKEKQKLRRSS